jgi:hypothetical protein
MDQQLHHLNSLKVPELRRAVRDILKENRDSKEGVRKLAFSLIKRGSWGNTYVGAHLLTEVSDLVTKQEFEQVVYRLANDPSWEVRENAAGLLKRLLLIDFDLYLEIMRRMVKSENPNIRRAAVVGSMQTKLNRTQIEKVAYHVYEPLLRDNDVYVRKNLGPFALNEILLRLHPDLATKYFDRWIKTKHPRVVWNILNAFQLSRLKKRKHGSHLKEARRYLRLAENLEDKTAQSAVKSLRRRIERVG